MLGSKEGPALGGHQRNMHRGRPPLVQVTCTSQDGAKEEVHVVPLAMAFIDNWTVGDLLQDLQLRIKHEVVNLQLQCNDGIGGCLYEEDLLETVLQDGDELICSLTDEGEHGAAQTPVGVGSGRSVRRVREGKRGQRRQVFGDSVKVKEEVYVESESPTPAARVGHPRPPPGPPQRTHIRERRHRSRTPPTKGLDCYRQHGHQPDSDVAGVRSWPPHIGCWRHHTRSWPPFMEAVYQEDVEATKLLLLAKANVNCTWNGGKQKTAIYYAIQFGNAELVSLLLQHGTDVHRQMRSPKKWVTPLELARTASPLVYQAFHDHGLGSSLETPAGEDGDSSSSGPDS